MAQGAILGTVVSAELFGGNFAGVILADGVFPDYAAAHGEWWDHPEPRDGRYLFVTTTAVTVGSRVYFDLLPGTGTRDEMLRTLVGAYACNISLY